VEEEEGGGGRMHSICPGAVHTQCTLFEPEPLATQGTPCLPPPTPLQQQPKAGRNATSKHLLEVVLHFSGKPLHTHNRTDTRTT
jgi:hypothetical protein